jgi:hypothetical protein
MIVLPINSVINPLLYDDFITRIAAAPLRPIRTSLVNSATYLSVIEHFRSAQVETIEMEQIEVREHRTGSVAAGNPN